jgi:hypothetical protein
MTSEQYLRMIKGGCALLLATLFVWLVFTTVGCTTTEAVYERVEVPMPYWNPPENIAPTPPLPLLQAGDLTRAEAEADPRAALRVVGQDLSAALAWGEQLAHLYAELVKLIHAEPAVLPPSDGGDGAPPGG